MTPFDSLPTEQAGAQGDGQAECNPCLKADRFTRLRVVALFSLH